MRLVTAKHQVLSSLPTLDLIEQAGRVCYQSICSDEEKGRNDFIQKRIEQGHESIIEHSLITVKFICDRGISHELVRHRLASYSQESTRYCNYKKEVVFIIPCWLQLKEGEYYGSMSGERSAVGIWIKAMLQAKKDYKALLRKGWPPEAARTVLPNSLKTEIIMSANYREWRHILRLRTSRKSHPQMREIMIPLLKELQLTLPSIFGDIHAEY